MSAKMNPPPPPSHAESSDDLHSNHEEDAAQLSTVEPLVTPVTSTAPSGEPVLLAPPAVLDRRWSESHPSPPNGNAGSHATLLDTSIAEPESPSSSRAPLSVASLDRTGLIPGRPPLSPTVSGGLNDGSGATRDRPHVDPNRTTPPVLPEPASVQFAASHTPPRALRPENSTSSHFDDSGSGRRRATGRQSQSGSTSNRQREMARSLVLRDDLPLVDIQLQPLRIVPLHRNTRESISGGPTDSSRRSSAGLRQSYLSSNSMMTVAAGRQTRPTSPSHFDPPRAITRATGEGALPILTGRDLELMERAQHARAAARVAAEQQLRGWPAQMPGATHVAAAQPRAVSQPRSATGNSRINGQRIRGRGAARGKNVYLGGLPPGTTDEILRLLCEPYGTVISTAVLNRNERRFGFVLMGTVEAATIVINQLNGHVLEGHRMHARYATNAPRSTSPQAAVVVPRGQASSPSLTPPTASVSPSSSANAILPQHQPVASAPSPPAAVQQNFTHHPSSGQHANYAYVASGPGGQRYLLVPQSQSWQYSSTPGYGPTQPPPASHAAHYAASAQALANERNSLLQRVQQLESQLRSLTSTRDSHAMAAAQPTPPAPA